MYNLIKIILIILITYLMIKCLCKNKIKEEFSDNLTFVNMNNVIHTVSRGG